MLYICHILGLLTLALAAPISSHDQLTNVAPTVWPSPMESSIVADSRSHGILIQIQPLDSIRVRSLTWCRYSRPPSKRCSSADSVKLISATIAIDEPLSMPSFVRQIAPRLVSKISPSPISSLHPQSQWSPSAISNVLFGCITSFLGVVTIVVTYYLSRRRFQRDQSGREYHQPLNIIALLMYWSIDELAELDDTSAFGTPVGGEIQPLQDLTISYTTINGGLDGANREDTESPVTPGAAHLNTTWAEYVPRVLAQGYLENTCLGQKEWKEILGEGKVKSMVWMVKSCTRKL